MRTTQIAKWLDDLIIKTALDSAMPGGQNDVNEVIKSIPVGVPSGQDVPDPEDIDIEFDQVDKQEDIEKKQEDEGGDEGEKPEAEAESSPPPQPDVTSEEQLKNQLEALKKQVEQLKTDKDVSQQLDDLKKQIDRIQVPNRNPDLNGSLFQSASMKIRHSRRKLRRICANHIQKKSFFNTKQIELMENYTKTYPELGYNQLANLISKEIFLNPHEIYFYLLSRPQKADKIDKLN
jgi:hypothetical protein